MTETIDVTAAIIWQEGQVFAARRAPGKHLEGHWEFPGGKVEKGESHQECLLRELNEELGITVNVGQFVGESVFDYGEKKVRLLAYNTELLDGEFTLKDHDEIRWVPINELEDLLWAPADIPFVRQILAGCDS